MIIRVIYTRIQYEAGAVAKVGAEGRQSCKAQVPYIHFCWTASLPPWPLNPKPVKLRVEYLGWRNCHAP